MQIQNILSRYADPTTKRQTEAIDAVTSTVDENSSSDVSTTTSATETAQTILEEYDVTDITPSEFSELVQRLYDAGVISQGELEQLASIRLDLDSAGIDSDESLDLLHFYRNRVEDARREEESGRTDSATMTNRLDWIEKFALVQGDSDTLGLDTFA